MIDRFVQPEFITLAAQGVRLTQYCAMTTPFEPNYVAAIGGPSWNG
jgi:hypothetical protein